MAKLPKEIREVGKKIDRSRFQIERRSKHWIIVDERGGLVFTLHTNHNDRGLANQLADLKKRGVLK